MLQAQCGAWRQVTQPAASHCTRTPRFKIVIKHTNADRLTVENGAGEEHQELDEQVLLLGGDLVEAAASSAFLDLCRGEALLDVGFEPLFWHDAGILIGGLTRVA